MRQHLHTILDGWLGTGLELACIATFTFGLVLIAAAFAVPA